MKNIILAGVACVALLSAGAAAADPFAVRYTGTMSTSNFPEISAGQTYDVTFVFDNGGTTATSQTWTSANLQCTIWRFNTARNVVYTQDLVANTAANRTGSATTNGAGVLQTMFSTIADTNVTTGFLYTGTPRAGSTYSWFANRGNGVFFNSAVGDVQDQGGGVPMAASNWSSPVPFVGDCAGRQLGAVVVPPTPVPTLSEWAMILLGLTLAGGAALIIQRRQMTA